MPWFLRQKWWSWLGILKEVVIQMANSLQRRKLSGFLGGRGHYYSRVSIFSVLAHPCTIHCLNRNSVCISRCSFSSREKVSPLILVFLGIIMHWHTQGWAQTPCGQIAEAPRGCDNLAIKKGNWNPWLVRCNMHANRLWQIIPQKLPIILFFYSQILSPLFFQRYR